MSKKLSFDEFLDRAKQAHGDKFDYSKVAYTNITTDISIICSKHGEFRQTPQGHLAGKGCRFFKSYTLSYTLAVRY